MNNKERISLMMILVMLLASCGTKQQSTDLETPTLSAAPSASSELGASNSKSSSKTQEEPAPKVLREDKSYIFLERNTDATDGGVTRLMDKMTLAG